MITHTWIFLSEPAIIHHKKFSAQWRNIIHHFLHLCLSHFKIYPFPTVQQYIPHLITGMYLLITCPTMKITAHSAQTFPAESYSKFRCRKRFTRLQLIFRSLFIYTSKETMIPIIIRIDTKFIITAPAQSGSYHPSRVFFGASIKWQHNFGMIIQRITHSILILYHFHSSSQRFCRNIGFRSPRSMQMRDPNISHAQRQKRRIKPFEHNLLSRMIHHLCPHFNNITLHMCYIIHPNFKRIKTVFQHKCCPIGLLLYPSNH